MQTLAQEIATIRPPAGGVALWWLAQAGFVFKTENGTVAYLDPYLSDVVEKAFGFKRLSLAPIAAEEVHADWLISSHEHLDHLDTDALPIILRNNPACRVAGPACCTPAYDACGVSERQRRLLEPGQQYRLLDITLHTARADHGDLSPDALSLVVEVGKVRILFTGDTALSFERIQPLIDLKPDVLLTCINGRFGNLDAEQAAELTARVAPRAVVPCHFWMFKEHNGDPEAFFQACARRCANVPLWLLKPGEGFVCTPQTITSMAEAGKKE